MVHLTKMNVSIIITKTIYQVAPGQAICLVTLYPYQYLHYVQCGTNGFLQILLVYYMLYIGPKTTATGTCKTYTYISQTQITIGIL